MSVSGGRVGEGEAVRMHLLAYVPFLILKLFFKPLYWDTMDTQHIQ